MIRLSSETERVIENNSKRRTAEMKRTPLCIVNQARYRRDLYLKDPILAEHDHRQLARNCAEYRAYLLWIFTQEPLHKGIEPFNLALYFLCHDHEEKYCGCN